MKPSSPNKPEQQPLGPISVLLTLLTIVLWGGNPVAMKFSLTGFPPIAIAAMRFGLATCFMIGWCVWARAPLMLRRGQWTPSLITGFLLFAQIALFNLGVHRTSTSHSTVLINTFIFWVVVLEHFVTGHHRLKWRATAGLAFAATGVLLLLTATQRETEQQQLDVNSLTGDLILAASAFVLGVKIVYTKHAVRTVPPGTLILWHDGIGVAMFIALSLGTERHMAWDPNFAAVVSLVYQGVFVAGICFALQAVLLRRHTASQISVFSFATPVVGVTLSILMRGDRLSPWLLASGLLVALGILLVNLPAKRSAIARTPTRE